MEAFDSWLYSAGHHRNMIGEGHAAIGIGVCGGTWTELMGGGTLWQLHARMKEIAYVKARYEAGGDVEKLLKLAQWCTGQKLLTQAEDELERILVLKPGHPGARTALEKLRSMLPR